MQKNTIPLKKNSIYDVPIDGWSSDGSGVAHIDGYGVFVPRTIKGERAVTENAADVTPPT